MTCLLNLVITWNSSVTHWDGFHLSSIEGSEDWNAKEMVKKLRHKVPFPVFVYSANIPSASHIQAYLWKLVAPLADCCTLFRYPPPHPSKRDNSELSKELFLGTLSHQGLQLFSWVRFRQFNCSSISWVPKSKLSCLSAFKVRDILQNPTSQWSRWSYCSEAIEIISAYFILAYTVPCDNEFVSLLFGV